MKDQMIRTVQQEAYKLYERNEDPQTPEAWGKYIDECNAFANKYEGKYAVLAARLAAAGLEAQCENSGQVCEKLSDWWRAKK